MGGLIIYIGPDRSLQKTFNNRKCPYPMPVWEICVIKLTSI